MSIRPAPRHRKKTPDGKGDHNRRGVSRTVEAKASRWCMRGLGLARILGFPTQRDRVLEDACGKIQRFARVLYKASKL